MAQPNPEISAMLDERIAAGDFPSAVYLVAHEGHAIFADALGHAVLEPEEKRRRATLETIYDLASLTKPLITAFLCAQMIERKALNLDETISRLLPEFDRADKRSITLRQLLTHSSGLPAWRPLYLTTGGERDKVLESIAAEELEYAPGTRVIYSDLGYITLGFVIERATDATIAKLSQSEIFQPLALKRTFFNPDMALQTEVAACETGNLYERETCEAIGAAQSYQNWRTSLIWGEVHDGNAHFLEGAAGHAGLFSNVSETLRLALQFLPKHTELLKAETCALFPTNMTPGLEEARSVGWQLAATKDSTAGTALPADSFGHLGFTGTSCWVDPQHERIFILLTNRTHAHTLPFVNINSVRRKFHTLAAAALEQRLIQSKIN